MLENGFLFGKQERTGGSYLILVAFELICIGRVVDRKKVFPKFLNVSKRNSFTFVVNVNLNTST